MGFYHDGLMGASSKSIKGAPKHRGKFSKKFRPGLRSIELKAKLNKGKPKQGTVKKPQGQGIAGPAGAQQGTIFRKPPTGGRSGMLKSPASGKGGGIHHKAMLGYVGDIHEQEIDGSIMGQCCYGYDDTTGPYDPNNPDTIPDNQYAPNGMVWVSNANIQIYSVNAVTGEYFPVTYPDGSPMQARLWLPGMDLTNFLPPILKSWFNRNIQTRGPVGALVSQQLLYYATSSGVATTLEQFADPNYTGLQVGWEQDPQGNWGYLLQIPKDNQPGGNKPSGLWNFFDGSRGIYQGKGNGAFGEFDSWVFPWDINFASHDPSSAYIFLKLFLPGAEVGGWTLQPADIQGVTRNFDPNNPPYGLPGFAWMDLNFLNNARLGAHGLPNIVNQDGTLNSAALSDFITKSQASESDPNQRSLWGWWRLLDLDPWQTGNSMLATVYDVASTVHVGTQGPLPPASPSSGNYPFGGDSGYYNDYNQQYPGYGQGYGNSPPPGDYGYGFPQGGYSGEPGYGDTVTITPEDAPGYDPFDTAGPAPQGFDDGSGLPSDLTDMPTSDDAGSFDDYGMMGAYRSGLTGQPRAYFARPKGKTPLAPLRGPICNPSLEEGGGGGGMADNPPWTDSLMQDELEKETIEENYGPGNVIDTEDY